MVFNLVVNYTVRYYKKAHILIKSTYVDTQTHALSSRSGNAIMTGVMYEKL